MAIFVMLIGVPASGKSTWAQSHERYNIVSSDAIRGELYGNEALQIDHAKVFAIAHERILKFLSEGKDVAFDATNIRYKNRRTIMEKVRKLPNVMTVAEVFAEPYRTLVERNKKRERSVPNEVIERMIRQFEMPTYAEGFDFINVNNLNSLSAEEFLEEAKNFNQDNPHHSFPLYEHCNIAANFFVNKPVTHAELRAAALYHDLGKLFTKTYLNSRGELSDHAHYYDHENVGAYYALMYKELKTACMDVVKVAQLINYHMMPYNEQTEKAKDRHRARLGDKLYNEVMMLHEADAAAH